jgi:tetratricopeptide (TPR) repeat protein
VDTQTRHALKHDRFVDTTNATLDWASENRGTLIRYGIITLAVIALIVAAIWTYAVRQRKAQNLLGQALSIYETPLRVPGEPADEAQGSFDTAAARAKAAYPLFEKAANQYGWLRPGEDARYFAGLADIDMGDHAKAETELKKASKAHDRNIAALAQMALASLYVQTNRSSEAIAIYNKLIQHPAMAVPASAAQLALASVYETSNPDKAKQIYAEVKDKDSKTAAGQIAAEQLQKLK